MSRTRKLGAKLLESKIVVLFVVNFKMLLYIMKRRFFSKGNKKIVVSYVIFLMATQ